MDAWSWVRAGDSGGVELWRHSCKDTSARIGQLDPSYRSGHILVNSHDRSGPGAETTAPNWMPARSTSDGRPSHSSIVTSAKVRSSRCQLHPVLTWFPARCGRWGFEPVRHSAPRAPPRLDRPRLAPRERFRCPRKTWRPLTARGRSGSRPRTQPRAPRRTLPLTTTIAGCSFCNCITSRSRDQSDDRPSIRRCRRHLRLMDRGPASGVISLEMRIGWTSGSIAADGGCSKQQP